MNNAASNVRFMIRLSVYYPATEGASFDHEYYSQKHVPLCLATWSSEGVTHEIDKGISGPYVAAVQFTFPDMETFGAGMASEGTGAIQADVVNYTTITPVMQISEIVG